MLFENHNFALKNYFRTFENKNALNFGTSSHRTFECYAVTRGYSVAKVNGVEYELYPGDAVLVFPFQRHEYKNAPETDTFGCIFSQDLVGSFYKGMRIVPKNNKFKFTPYEITHPENLFVQKALCYDICAKFDISAEYETNVGMSSGVEEVILKMLLYISDNYTSDCSLKDVAVYLGYDYRYISKLFKRIVGAPFASYVNAMRVSEACRLLLIGGSSLQEIAASCGFGCMRSFNRVFKDATGQTPKEYARSKRSRNPSPLLPRQ